MVKTPLIGVCVVRVILDESVRYVLCSMLEADEAAKVMVLCSETDADVIVICKHSIYSHTIILYKNLMTSCV